jgi:hypothetical protein
MQPLKGCDGSPVLIVADASLIAKHIECVEGRFQLAIEAFLAEKIGDNPRRSGYR